MLRWKILGQPAVASGQFLNEGGEIVEATAVTANRWIPQLRQAVEAAGEVAVNLRDVVQQYPSRVADAEQLLLEWAQRMNYRIISIVPAGKPMCPACDATLKAASDAQRAAIGFGFYFY